MTQDPPTIFPAIRYRDAAAAIEWLERAFGFRRLMVVPGEDGAVMHAELKLGNGVVMLGTADEPAEHGSDPASHEGLYVYVADLDRHYQQAKAAGATIARELEDTDYGSRQYAALDPEGRPWTFGTYMPDLSGAAS
ncbi:MAG: glyoxalase [Dehalococcoidia bacterium]|nr:glyoxalase [Dehalococcoidia bacterium]